MDFAATQGVLQDVGRMTFALLRKYLFFARPAGEQGYPGAGHF
jgi:hypothetical protein